MKLSADSTFAARSSYRRKAAAPSLPAEPRFWCDGGRIEWSAEDFSPYVTPLDAWIDVDATPLTLAQATVASQPAWSTSEWRGTTKGITLDGVDDFMSVASTTGIPTGANAGEIWLTADQTTEATTTDALTIFAYGGTTAGTYRAIQRVVVDGINRVRVTDGTVSVTDAEVDFSGPHYIRAWFSGTEMGLAVDGRDVGSVALVPATGTDIVTLGIATSATGATWGGTVRQIMAGTGLCTESDVSHNEQFGEYWRS